MNKKCSGCGVTLQTDKPEIEGYIEPEMYEKSKICRRCFRLKFYGDYIFVHRNNDDYEDFMQKISKTGDLIIYVVDVLNISEELINVDKLLNNPFLLVLSKKDVLPKSVKDDRVLDYLDTYKLDIVDSLCVSSEKNYNIDHLYKLILKYKKSNNVYIIGNTNSGKSTLINKMIKNYSDSKTVLTTSILPTTTLDLMEIKLNDKVTLIDTPGFIETGNIVNNCDFATLRKISPRKEIKPKTYQLDPKHSIRIDTLVQIDYLEGLKNSFTFYVSNDLNLEVTNLNYKVGIYKNIKQTFIVNGGEDIVISGLGWFKVVGAGTIDVYVNENVKVFQRVSII